MELIVLGAGPAYSDRAGSVGASYLLVHNDRALVLDLGQGAFPALARATEPSRLLAVVISHLHPDHFIDLVPLRHYLRYEFEPPRRVTVHAPAGLARRLDALHDEPGFTTQALDVVELSAEIHSIGPFELEAALVTHNAESYAFRVRAGADAGAGRGVDAGAGAGAGRGVGAFGAGPSSVDGPGFVYSGDCGRADDLRTLIRPGDTLLTEVAFGPGPVPPGAQHLDGPAVGRLAAASGVGRLLLTHLQMGFDPGETIASVRAWYDGEVRFVWPGDRLEV